MRRPKDKSLNSSDMNIKLKGKGVTVDKNGKGDSDLTFCE